MPKVVFFLVFFLMEPNFVGILKYFGIRLFIRHILKVVLLVREKEIKFPYKKYLKNYGLVVKVVVF